MLRRFLYTSYVIPVGTWIGLHCWISISATTNVQQRTMHNAIHRDVVSTLNAQRDGPKVWWILLEKMRINELVWCWRANIHIIHTMYVNMLAMECDMSLVTQRIVVSRLTFKKYWWKWGTSLAASLANLVEKVVSFLDYLSMVPTFKELK